MDRNKNRLTGTLMAVAVALRKESVDRNSTILTLLIPFHLSLSARRAWIEIKIPHRAGARYESLSARRAWIEMQGRWQLNGQFPRRSPQGERG